MSLPSPGQVREPGKYRERFWRWEDPPVIRLRRVFGLPSVLGTGRHLPPPSKRGRVGLPWVCWRGSEIAHWSAFSNDRTCPSSIRKFSPLSFADAFGLDREKWAHGGMKFQVGEEESPRAHDSTR